MRILIVVHGYPPTFTGGAELRAERTARGLAARGHEIAVLCIESLAALETQLVGGALSQDGVLVHRLHLEKIADLEGGDQHSSSQVVQDALLEMIREWRPNAIHLFSGYLMGTAVINTAVAHNVPVVVSLTDYWWICHRINLIRTNGARCDGPSPVSCARCRSEMYRRFRLPSNVARPLIDGLWQLAEYIPVLRAGLGVDDQARRLEVMLAALNKATGLIAPSQFLADMYMRYGIHRALMHVWRQGVNLAFCPHRRPSPTLRFGYFGQIKHHKGIHTLIEAWGRLRGSREYSLTIYGSSHGEEAYGAQMRERSHPLKRVTWHQSIAHNDVWQALAEIDVLVIPSRWYENSPNVILEAQAMGVVVIGSDLGGIAELVHHGHNGLLFQPDDAESLGAQMQRMLDEPELLEALRRNHIPFRSFNDELDQIEALYEHVLTQTVAGGALDHPVLESNIKRLPGRRPTTVEME
jgi:glycosyltransferase involved in cell wall biosynthesis